MAVPKTAALPLGYTPSVARNLGISTRPGKGVVGKNVNSFVDLRIEVRTARRNTACPLREGGIPPGFVSVLAGSGR